MPFEKRSSLTGGERDHLEKARQIVTQIAHGCQSPNGFGHFSVSVYDTAWVSMVSKANIDGSRRWLFPELFDFVLGTQSSDGSWRETEASPVDVILNTMAGLLTLLVHRTVEKTGEGPQAVEYERRISTARDALSRALCAWDVGSTVHVGFEVLVPNLLRQLGQYGVKFDFPCKTELLKLNERKLLEFRPEMVTSAARTTLLHSLEGLVGQVDFDQLAHHCTAYGGLMGSPASTAAYLIHSKAWDGGAEQYLRNAVRNYGFLGVPSGFPTPIFETTWIVSILQANGYDIDEFPSENMGTICAYLQRTFDNQQGLVGFAPGFLPDADDTSMIVLALAHLCTEVDVSSLIDYSEITTHFKTYKLERDPSVSANSNVLRALLTSPFPGRYMTQIEKAVRFMLSCWDDGNLHDKWNLAAEYSEMLLASALVRLMRVWDSGLLESFPRALVAIHVPIALCQLLSKTLGRQLEDGSWHRSPERTAYSVLLLSKALALPWPVSMRQYCHAALLKGRNYLACCAGRWGDGDDIWIEKVTYRLPILSETYCVSAMRASIDQESWSNEVYRVFTAAEVKLQMMSRFFGTLPLFQNTQGRTMVFAIMEGKLYSEFLKIVRLDIFPRDEIRMTEDKYLNYIPVAWTTVNAAAGFPLSANEMWEMMVLSMLNYQADEYMESVVANLPDSRLAELKFMISDECVDGLSVKPPLFQSSDLSQNSPLSLTPPVSEHSSQPSTPSTAGVVTEVLKRYIRQIRSHFCVAGATESAQRQVAEELYKFLLAHLAHNADNARLRMSSNGNQSGQVPMVEWSEGTSSQPYFDWVRSTGANDTSCPYSFTFFCCLLSKGGSYCLSSPKTQYFGRAMAVHLATMCRQYNDYGSHERDALEGNLNSLDFAEFTNSLSVSASTVSAGWDSDDQDKRTKQALAEIAECERACMQQWLTFLSAELGARTSAKIKAFVDVTDLFGQIYVARDIASRAQR